MLMNSAIHVLSWLVNAEYMQDMLSCETGVMAIRHKQST